MATTLQAAELGTFEFSVKCRREDASNGFLDLKAEGKALASLADSIGKNEIVMSYGLVDAYKPRQIIQAGITSLKTVVAEQFYIGTVRFYIAEVARTRDGGILRIEFLDIADETEIKLTKATTLCITVPPSELVNFFVGQHIAIKFTASALIWNDEAESDGVNNGEQVEHGPMDNFIEPMIEGVLPPTGSEVPTAPPQENGADLGVVDVSKICLTCGEHSPDDVYLGKECPHFCCLTEKPCPDDLRGCPDFVNAVPGEDSKFPIVSIEEQTEAKAKAKKNKKSKSD